MGRGPSKLRLFGAGYAKAWGLWLSGSTPKNASKSRPKSMHLIDPDNRTCAPPALVRGPWEKTRRRPERIERAREDKSTLQRARSCGGTITLARSQREGKADATERAAASGDDGADAVQSGPNATKRCVVQSPCSLNFLAANRRLSPESTVFWAPSPQSPDKRLQRGIGVPSPAAAADPLPPRPSLTARRRPRLLLVAHFLDVADCSFLSYVCSVPCIHAARAPKPTHTNAPHGPRANFGAGGTHHLAGCALLRCSRFCLGFGLWSLGLGALGGGRPGKSHQLPTHPQGQSPFDQFNRSMSAAAAHTHAAGRRRMRSRTNRAVGGKRRLLWMGGWAQTARPRRLALCNHPRDAGGS